MRPTRATATGAVGTIVEKWNAHGEFFINSDYEVNLFEQICQAVLKQSASGPVSTRTPHDVFD
jgi:hypothetical protein